MVMKLLCVRKPRVDGQTDLNERNVCEESEVSMIGHPPPPPLREC